MYTFEFQTKKSIEELRRSPYHQQLGRNVCSAFLAQQQGIRMDTRGVFERYNITDQSDTIEAGKMAEEFLTREHAQDSSQITSQTKGRPN